MFFLKIKYLQNYIHYDIQSYPIVGIIHSFRSFRKLTFRKINIICMLDVAAQKYHRDVISLFTQRSCSVREQKNKDQNTFPTSAIRS